MTEDNIKDFVVNWTIAGLLMFCLISFTIMFMYSNNPIGLNDGTDKILNTTSNGINNKLMEVNPEANNLLNITSNTNPETSYLGSRDSVATAYSTYGTAKSFWTQSITLISWVFSGVIGQILITVIGGLLGFMGVYYIIQLVRQGK